MRVCWRFAKFYYLCGASKLVLSDDRHLEADLTKLSGIQNQTTIEQECGLVHVIVDLLVVQSSVLELIPLGNQDNGISIVACFVCAAADGDVLLNLLAGVNNTGFTQVSEDLFMVDLGVIDSNTSMFLDEILDQSDSSSLTGITGVLLECKAEDSDLLVRDGVEQGRDDVANESLLLVFVHDDNLLPVSSNLGKVELLRKVHKVKNILLEARTTETNRCLQELGSDTAIATAGISNLIDIGTSGFTDGRESVYGGDTLSKESISSLFDGKSITLVNVAPPNEYKGYQ